MSNGYRNGAFALGLVTGGGIALNLFLWLDYKAQREADLRPDPNGDASGNEVGNIWDGLIGTFVSPSDTLAQWVMVFLTIVAVLLVRLTLVATQEMVRDTKQMAIDTRKIGDEQLAAGLAANTITREAMQATIRPFIVITQRFMNESEWRSGEVDGEWQVEIRNYGNGPALLTDAKSQTWIGPDGRAPEFPPEKRLINIGFAGAKEDSIIHPGKSISKADFISRLGQGVTDPGALRNRDVERLRNREIFGWLDVTIAYESLYGTRHETKALFRIENFLATTKQFGGKERNYRT